MAGHFHLPFLANRGPIVQVTADYRRATLLDYLQRKQNRPERHAIRNLLGVLAFVQGDNQGALGHFDNILAEDPDNLNALANRGHVANLLPNPAPHVAAANLVPDLATQAGRKMQARCYAEQAFAFMFELYDETITHQRYTDALRLYEEAMELAGELVDSVEKEDWQFAIGLANSTILGITMDPEAGRSGLRRAAQNFGALVENPSTHAALRSEAWMHLGLAFSKVSRGRLFNVGQGDVPGSLVQYVNNPEGCLQQALKLSPDDRLRARILARIAPFRDRARDSERAIELLNESINLDSSNLNFHAYSTRARLCVKKYERSLGRNVANPDQINLLHQARSDLEFILKQHVSPWDFEKLAEVYFLLAKSTRGDPYREYIQKALEKCSQSETCQDGANRPSLHKLRGEILCYNGQHQQAKESFQRGFLCEQETGERCGNEQLLAQENQHL